MEFNIDQLNKIIMSLTNAPSVGADNSNTNTSSTTVKKEPSTSNEQQTSNTTNNDSTRQYCLIIFNNPSWSQRLRKKSPQLVVKVEEDEQQRQQIKHEINHSEDIAVQCAPPTASLDDLFIAQLRQLINDYMLRTQRPFPIKFFLDFTTN